MDEWKVNEAILFTMNDYDSYTKLMDIYKPNLEKKVLKGIYDKDKALKLLEYHYKNYARPLMKMPRKYGKDLKLNPAERKAYATYFRDYLWGEYLEPLSKKMPNKNKSLKDNKTKVRLLKYSKTKNK
jgi:hypothetical protein